MGRTGAGLVLAVLVVAALGAGYLAVSSGRYTTIVTSQSYTSSSTAAGSTPLWIYRANGAITSVSVSENGNYTVVAEQVFFNNSGGAILLFNRAGDLLWERQTDWVVSDAAISDNGSHILALGHKFLYGPGQPTSQANEVFALDSNGSVLWNTTSSSPYYGGAMSTDGSRVAVFTDDYVALLTWSGQVLWNDSAAGADFCPGVGPCPVFVSQDGSVVAAGHQGITLFNPDGSVAWTFTRTDGETNNVWANSVTLTSSGYLIAAAQDSNFNDTALLLTGQGVPLWEHHLDSQVFSAALLQDGSTIGYVTDSSALFYDRNGTLLANYTTDGELTLLPTSNGTFLLGGGGNDLALFDSAGQERWSSPLQTVLTAAVSGDDAFVAATTGARGEGALGPSTLYFFSTS
ncbi:MAG: PQQ-binding-like beta-propeller repeat protein [Thaumarchaeota archaeon]|nr:PQQ-binding-like beta-propeller repeat protein [Nitrososphaerota archaeon]